jgi:hypothetical protein
MSSVAEPPTLEILLQRLGVPASALDKVLSGDVVTHELRASSDKDLSLLVLCIVSASAEVVHDFAAQERVHELQEATLSVGLMDPEDPMIGLEAMDLEEETVASLLKNPHLSDGEVERVQAASLAGKGAHAYKEILAERVTAYWNEGLDGIVPYAGTNRDPKVDLQHAIEATLKIILDETARKEIKAVPSQSLQKDLHSFEWALQKGNKQIAPVLNHSLRMENKWAMMYVVHLCTVHTWYCFCIKWHPRSGVDSSLLVAWCSSWKSKCHLLVRKFTNDFVSI